MGLDFDVVDVEGGKLIFYVFCVLERFFLWINFNNVFLGLLKWIEIDICYKIYIGR